MNDAEGVDRGTGIPQTVDGAPRRRQGGAGAGDLRQWMKPQVQEHIGRQLRAVYDDVLKQPVPDRFRELMEKLDQKIGDAE